MAEQKDAAKPAGKLPPDEQAYHNEVNAAYKAAAATFNSWAAYLVKKYRIGDGERIDEAGVVWKVPAVAPVADEAPAPINRNTRRAAAARARTAKA